MTLHRSLAFRQIRRSGAQALIFVLCVQLSMVSLVAINGFAHNVRKSILRDTRSLHAGDIIIRSNYPFSETMRHKVAALESQGRIRSAATLQFHSLVRTVTEDASLLCSLKVVAPQYPFYGRVELRSGKALGDVLTAGRIVVEQALLERLGLSEGDELRVGRSVLTIADVVLREPDQPLTVFTLGPRILVALADLDQLHLILPGSRVRYKLLVKVTAPLDMDAHLKELKAAAGPDERVDSYETAPSRIQRFFDNLLFFLALMGILTLLLAGIGIQSTLGAMLKKKEQTIAIMKTVGAGSRFISLHFMLMVSILGTAGTLLGLGSGYLLQFGIPWLFRGVLPASMPPVFTLPMLGETLLLGLMVVALFCFLPLHGLKTVKPVAILRHTTGTRHKGAAYYATALVIGLFFASAILWQLKDIKTGFYFIGGILALIALSALATRLALLGLGRVHPRKPALRQALRGLFRPGNLTRAVITTLTASLAALFTIYLVERNLNDSFIRAYPAETPNLFCINIQPDQRENFQQVVGREARFYPVIRARLTAINGALIDPAAERKRRGDNLARPFNLTYRDHLLPDEHIVAGPGLFAPGITDIQVSVLDSVTEIRPMGLGDRLAFNIQGIPITATVTSIRSRQRETFSPFFYFVFKAEALETAPQTIFTALKVPKAEIASLQTRIVSHFPNVSVIDLSATLTRFAGIMERLAGTVRFFGGFSILAGLLIIVSAVFATRLSRIREAVYYKILGARQSFVFTVFTLENMFIGLASGLLALTLAQAGSWLICTRFLEISDYRWYPAAGLGMLGINCAWVVLVGLLASRSILKKKPVVFLREQSPG